MSHKADRSFFNVKRPWSLRKDRILGSYLTAYLAKIATQGKPVLIVDAFAGPGGFKDGSPGSPQIIFDALSVAKKRPQSPRLSALFIEVDGGLFSQLANRFSNSESVQTRNQSFLSTLGEIEALVRTHSVFLYLDPYTVAGLEWESMDRVFRKAAESRASVEVLLNFNAASFVRRALAALKQSIPEPDPNEEDPEQIDASDLLPPTVAHLNKVVGGDWWQEICTSNDTFATKVALLTERLRLLLRKRLRETCYHDVKALPSHKVPKYFLVYGSRSHHGLRLMNDEMVKSRQSLAELAAPTDPVLFEMRPEVLVPDVNRIPALVLRHAANPTPRGEVIVRVIRDAFCEYSSSQIRQSIENLLKNGRLRSATGKTRINDDVAIQAV